MNDISSLVEAEGDSRELLGVVAVKDRVFEEVEILSVTLEGPETTDVSMADPEVGVAVEVDIACLSKELVFAVVKLDEWCRVLVIVPVSNKVELVAIGNLENVVAGVDDVSKLDDICERDIVIEAKLLEY